LEEDRKQRDRGRTSPLEIVRNGPDSKNDDGEKVDGLDDGEHAEWERGREGKVEGQLRSLKRGVENQRDSPPDIPDTSERSSEEGGDGDDGKDSGEREGERESQLKLQESRTSS